MTRCSSPMAPSTAELLRSVFDEEALSPAVAEHVKTCILCQERLSRYKASNNFLLTQLYRSQCPDVTSLNHYCAGLLSHNEAERIEAHVQECPLCATEVQETRMFLTNRPPFSQHDLSVQQLQELVPSEELLSVPQVTSSSEVPVTSWPYRYQTAELNLVLHLSCSALGQLTLYGHLSSPISRSHNKNLEGSTAKLYICLKEQREELARTVRVDSVGDLAFSDLPVGTYMLVLQTLELDVVVENLFIAPPHTILF